MNKISVVVADDEKFARTRLIDLLEKCPEIGRIRECSNGREAVDAITAERPGLLFLDVQMPELDGFGALAQLGPDRMPTTVFVTAYDQFAVRAFESRALDYLLKPFSDERFEDCLARALENIRMHERGDLGARLQDLLQNWTASRPAAAPRFLERVAIKSGGKVVFVEIRDVVRIEAAGVYVDIYTRDKTYLCRATLGELESRLDPDKFVRIHRSSMVNLLSIRELRPHSHGDSIVVLKDGTELKLSRNYRARLEAALGQPI